METLTIVKNEVTIDGKTMAVVSSLPEDIIAVQYHKIRSEDTVLEEPLMTVKNLRDYEYFIEEFNEQIALNEEPTEEELQADTINAIKAQFPKG